MYHVRDVAYQFELDHCDCGVEVAHYEFGDRGSQHQQSKTPEAYEYIMRREERDGEL